MDKLQQERERLAGLQSLRATSAQKKFDLEQERGRLAYAALGADDKVAGKRLKEIHRAISEHDSECASITAAVEEASLRVSQAEQEEEHQAVQARAREARTRLLELRRVGTEAAKSLSHFVIQLAAFEDVAAEIARLNIGGPQGDLVRVNLRRAVQSELFKVGLGEMLQPSQRVGLQTLIDSWSINIEGAIARLLDESAEAAD
jgi:FAD/FMN-containing dehydrogenase